MKNLKYTYQALILVVLLQSCMLILFSSSMTLMLFNLAEHQARNVGDVRVSSIQGPNNEAVVRLEERRTKIP